VHGTPVSASVRASIVVAYVRIPFEHKPAYLHCGSWGHQNEMASDEKKVTKNHMSCLPLDVRVNVTAIVLWPRTTMREPQPAQLLLGLHLIARIFFFPSRPGQSVYRSRTSRTVCTHERAGIVLVPLTLHQ
jgi:hypothetical protein